MKTSKVESDTKRSSRTARATASDASPPKSRSRTSPSRSPARNRRPSPGSKASRRSPARKPSPSRKSPARKSPSRNAKEIEDVPKSPSRRSPARSARDSDNLKSPAKRPAIKSESISKISTEYTVTSSVKSEDLKPKTRQTSSDLIKESVVLLEDSNDLINGSTVVSVRDGLRDRKIKLPEFSSQIQSRRSTRLKSTTDNFEKLQTLAQNTKLPQSDYAFDNFSDSDKFSDEEIIPKKARSITRTLITPLRESSTPRNVHVEFGGSMGVVCQMLFMPLFILAVNLVCDGPTCNYTSWPNLQIYRNLNRWINLKSVLLYLSFILIQLLVSLLPCCGKRVPMPDGNGVFVANGIFSVFVTLSVIAGLEYLDIPVFNLIYSQYIPLYITALIYGICVSIVLFIRSRNIRAEDRNVYANTGSIIYDFWMGPEVNPCIFGKIHIKRVFLRTAMIAALLINITNLYQGTSVKNFPILSMETAKELGTYKQAAESISVSPTLLVFASMQIFYFLHALAGEYKLASTFEYQYEGIGLMLILGYSVYPFTTMSITRYIVQHNAVLPSFILAIAVVVYLIGFYIYHASNAEKSAFRENPNNPKLNYLNSIPTFQGKRLLVSGWWGFVRHPNYLGDIILTLSWGAAVSCAPPGLFILATVFFLAHRASRDGQRCGVRYGAAWVRYCNRVPYNILPRVY